MLHKLATIAKTLAYPGGWRFAMSRGPRSATSFRIASELKKIGFDFRTVIDGGANEGQFSRACSEQFPNANFICFEPLPEVADSLERHLADIPSLRVVRSALGQRDGETTFLRASNSQCSSILPFGDADDNWAGVTTESNLTVPIGSLDSVLKDTDLTSPVLLKLDLQGYELEALRGGVEVLKKCDCVILEAGFDEMYQGQPSFDDLWTFLAQNDFRLAKLLNTVADTTGSIVQVDGLFIRNEQIELSDDTTSL